MADGESPQSAPVRVGPSCRGSNVRSGSTRAIRVLAEAQANNWLATGLIYIETGKPSLSEIYNLVETPLNRLQEADLRPGREMIKKINDLMF